MGGGIEREMWFYYGNALSEMEFIRQISASKNSFRGHGFI